MADSARARVDAKTAGAGRERENCKVTRHVCVYTSCKSGRTQRGGGEGVVDNGQIPGGFS